VVYFSHMTLTKEDKGFLHDTFATKADFAELKQDMSKLKQDVSELQVSSTLIQQAIQRIERNGENTEGKIDQILTIVQNLAGNIAGLEQENKMGAITLRRHDIQIHELAAATGTAISD
jgi:outer membrane murein-binding lipoprotein Lpp